MTLETINLKGNDYATVPTRLKEFRSTNPRSSVETEPTITGDMVMFKATIRVDKADENSATSTGHSYGKLTGDKSFEKLETVAVGRALSLLGYLNNGQVASTEEMLEFEEHKQTQLLEDISNAQNRQEMQEIVDRLTPEQQLIANPFIKARIEELKEKASVTAHSS